MPCRHSPRVRGTLALLTASDAILASSLLYAQATTAVDPCDPTLARATKDPLAYGRRGDRCEGLYIKDVAGIGGLQVAAFVESGTPFEIATGERLQVAWSQPAEAAVQLRAVALQRRKYYRMDVVRDRARTFEGIGRRTSWFRSGCSHATSASSDGWNVHWEGASSKSTCPSASARPLRPPGQVATC